jgi:cytochrome b6-f complex iron-sulfur subunit
MSDLSKEDVSLSRRKVMAWGLWAIAGIVAAGAVWPVVELVSERRSAKKKARYFPAIPIDDMPEVGVKKIEMNLRGGALPDTRIFIRREPAGELTAFSAICTHLGCLVDYNRLKGEFICPCHGGRYASDGHVVAGPPPAPLNRLPVKVESGNIMIGFKI